MTDKYQIISYDISNINLLISDISDELKEYLIYVSKPLSKIIDVNVINNTSDNILDFFIYISNNINTINKNKDKDIIIEILDLINKYILIINYLIVFYTEINSDIIYNGFMIYFLLNILISYVKDDVIINLDTNLNTKINKHANELVNRERPKGRISRFYLINYDEPQQLISVYSTNINTKIKSFITSSSSKSSLKSSLKIKSSSKFSIKVKKCCKDNIEYFYFKFSIIKLLNEYMQNAKNVLLLNELLTPTLQTKIIDIQKIIPYFETIIEKMMDINFEKDEIITSKLYAKSIIVKIVDFILNTNHILYETNNYIYVKDGHDIIKSLTKFKEYLNDNKTIFEYESYNIDKDIIKKQLTIEEIDTITGNIYKKNANEIKCNIITYESIDKDINVFFIDVNESIKNYFLDITNLLKNKIVFSYYPDDINKIIVFIDNIELFIYYILKNIEIISSSYMYDYDISNITNVIIDIINLIKYCNYYLIKYNKYDLIINGIKNIILLNVICKYLKKEDLNEHDVKCEKILTKIESDDDFLIEIDKLNYNIWNDYEKSSNIDERIILNKIEKYSTKINNINIRRQGNDIIFSGGKNKIKVIYKKKEYTRNIYINEHKKYVKINNTLMLLSKLKKI
jgi:hypothetical protein